MGEDAPRSGHLIPAGQPDRRPLLILVRTLARSYREYLLASIAARYRIWLVQEDEPGWPLPYLAGHSVLDPLDAGALVAATRGLTLDLPALGHALRRPVVAVDPRGGRGLGELVAELGRTCLRPAGQDALTLAHETGQVAAGHA